MRGTPSGSFACYAEIRFRNGVTRFNAVNFRQAADARPLGNRVIARLATVAQLTRSLCGQYDLKPLTFTDAARAHRLCADYVLQ